MTTAFERTLEASDASAPRGPGVNAVSPRPNARESRPPADADARVEAAMTFLRERFLEPTAVAAMHRMAGMSLGQFRRAFIKRYGKLPGVVRAGLQVERAKSLLKQGASLPTLWEHTGFSSNAVFFGTFKEVAGMTPTAWLLSELHRDPTGTVAPSSPKPSSADVDEEHAASPKRTGWQKGSAANYRQEKDRKSRDAAEVARQRPASSGPKRTAAELSGAAAFDAHQKRVAEERAEAEATATSGEPGLPAPHHRPAVPSHRRGADQEAMPINPARIPVADATQTMATCFDRFARDRSRRLCDREDVPDGRPE